MTTRELNVVIGFRSGTRLTIPCATQDAAEKMIEGIARVIDEFDDSTFRITGMMIVPGEVEWAVIDDVILPPESEVPA